LTQGWRQEQDGCCETSRGNVGEEHVDQCQRLLKFVVYDKANEFEVDDGSACESRQWWNVASIYTPSFRPLSGD
jgi:hypothetical protein